MEQLFEALDQRAGLMKQYTPMHTRQMPEGQVHADLISAVLSLSESLLLILK